MNKHIRHGVGSVRPYIHGPVALVDFVKQVFTASELERNVFGPQSFHAELKIGDGVVVIEAGQLPEDVEVWKSSVYVYVEDVDSAYEKAIALNAKSISEPADKPYNERQAGFMDAGGNTWWVSTYKPEA